MWAIHRVESTGGNLTVYARNPDGGKFPHWATGEALAKVAASLPCTVKVRGTVRSLTADEMSREHEEVAACDVTLNAMCGAADRGAVEAMIAEMRRCMNSVAYTAIDFPSAGWCGDSAAYVHIPMGGC